MYHILSYSKTNSTFRKRGHLGVQYRWQSKRAVNGCFLFNKTLLAMSYKMYREMSAYCILRRHQQLGPASLHNQAKVLYIPIRGPNLFFKYFSWVWYDPHLTYLWWPSKVKLFLRGCEHQGPWLCWERFLLRGREHCKPETLVSFEFNPR